MPKLRSIYKAVVVAKLTYAASVWWGFTSADDRRRIEAVLRRGNSSMLLSVRVVHRCATDTEQ